MILDFEPGLAARYRSLKNCIASGVYQRGLTNVAGDLDQAPGNLSVQLSEDGSRHFSIDSFELYLEKTRDMTPIFYLVEKFLGDKTAKKTAALEQIQALGPQMIELLRLAGITS